MIKNKYLEFTPKWSGFDIKYHIAGYFDPKPMIQIYFIWGKLFIYLPWRHKKKREIEKTLKEQRTDKLKKCENPNFIPKKVYKKTTYDECDPPRYGVYIYMNSLCFCLGRKTKIYDFPWSLDWVRTSYLGSDGKWVSETRKTRDLNFWDDTKWKGLLFEETYPYIYVTENNTTQNADATIRVVEREWRWKWFKWLKWTRFSRKVIDVSFSTDIGERKGSWKGGCTGCSYDMLLNETPYETLKRMEKERRFK